MTLEAGVRRAYGARPCALCEHVFVSIKGGSYARFQRALKGGNLTAVRMAALELPYVNLADAFAICLLMRRQGDPDFERAAVRWLARLCLERSKLTLTELRDAANAMMTLPPPGGPGDACGASQPGLNAR